MEERFDYVILTEYNEWVATGKGETEKQLKDELKRLKSEDPDRELMVFKAKELQMSSH